MALYTLFVFTSCESDSTSSFTDTKAKSNLFIGDFEKSIDESLVTGSTVGKLEVINDSITPITEIELYGISSEYFNVAVDGTITLSSYARLNQSVKKKNTIEAIATNLSEESNRGVVNINISSSQIPRLENTNLNIDDDIEVNATIGNMKSLSSDIFPITEISLSGEGYSNFTIDTNGTVKVSPIASFDYTIKNLYTLEVTPTNINGKGVASDLIITLNSDINVSQLPLVVIAVSFNDYKIEDSELNWSNKIYGNSFGEINHYYREMTNSKFSIAPVEESSGILDNGIIKVKLEMNHPGNNSMNNSHLAQAVSLADSYINFSSYDKNSNLNIEKDELQIVFIIAGGETAYGDSFQSSIWAHTSGFSNSWVDNNESPPVVDGVKIMDIENSGNYSRFGEKHGNHFATIGMIVHELGHSIWGLPDLYDRDQSSAGIGAFGLMSKGTWSAKDGEYPGTTPSHMCGWSKLQTGYVEAQEISSTTGEIELYANHTDLANIVKVPTENPNEYFLVENRSVVGYDSGLFRMEERDFSGGVAIWHIDEGQRVFQNDNELHKLVDLEEANNPLLDTTPNSNGKITNLYYGTNVSVFNSITTPNSSDYNGSETNISISNISALGNSANEYLMYIDVTK